MPPPPPPHQAGAAGGAAGLAGLPVGQAAVELVRRGLEVDPAAAAAAALALLGDEGVGDAAGAIPVGREGVLFKMLPAGHMALVRKLVLAASEEQQRALLDVLGRSLLGGVRVPDPVGTVIGARPGQGPSGLFTDLRPSPPLPSPCRVPSDRLTPASPTPSPVSRPRPTTTTPACST